jgi:hypothetical protein
MNRREMLADGFRFLSRGLPAMVANAASLGFLLRKPGGPVLDSQPGCFPAQTAAMVQQTSTPCQRRDKDGNKPP